MSNSNCCSRVLVTMWNCCSLVLGLLFTCFYFCCCFPLELLFTYLDKRKTFILAVRLFLAVLAITDFVSDVELLRSLRDTRSKYESDQQYVAEVTATNQYEYEYCVPIVGQTELTNAVEQSVHDDCYCLDAIVSCDPSSDSLTIFYEDVELQQQLMPNHDDAGELEDYFFDESQTMWTTGDSDYDFVEHLVHSAVDCRPYLWGQGYSHATTFTYLDWTCSHCECDGDLYDANTSYAMLEVQNQYKALYGEQPRYCNAAKMVDTEHNRRLDNLVIVCTTFVVIGALAQLVHLAASSIITWLLLENYIETDKDNLHKEAAEMVLSFFLSLMEDVPQTIVVMYYLKFLYEDTGFNCYDDFARYPKLAKMDINPADSIMIILFQNPSIAFAVMMSIIMIVVSGVRIGVSLVMSYAEHIEDRGQTHVQKFMAVSFVISFPVLYVFDLLMPIAAVAYFAVAGDFDKEWNPAFNIFVIGCVTWFLTFFIPCALKPFVKMDDEQEEIQRKETQRRSVSPQGSEGTKDNTSE